MSNKKRKTILLLQDSKMSDLLLEYFAEKYSSEGFFVIVFCDNILISFSRVKNKENLLLKRKPIEIRYLDDVLKNFKIDYVIYLNHTEEIYKIGEYIKLKQSRAIFKNNINLKDFQDAKIEIRQEIKINKFINYNAFNKRDIFKLIKDIKENVIFKIKIEKIQEEISVINRNLKDFLKLYKNKGLIKIDTDYLEYERYLILTDEKLNYEILSEDNLILDDNLKIIKSKSCSLNEDEKYIFDEFIRIFITQNKIANNLFSISFKNIGGGHFLFKTESIGIEEENFISNVFNVRRIRDAFVNVQLNKHINQIRELLTPDVSPDIKYIVFLRDKHSKILFYNTEYEFIKKKNIILNEIKISKNLILWLKNYINNLELNLINKSNLPTKLNYIESDKVIINSILGNLDFKKIENQNTIKLERKFSSNYSEFVFKNRINEEPEKDKYIFSQFLLDNILLNMENCFKIEAEKTGIKTSMKEIIKDEEVFSDIQNNHRDTLKISKFIYKDKDKEKHILTRELSNGYFFNIEKINPFLVKSELEIDNNLQNKKCLNIRYLVQEDSSLEINMKTNQNEEMRDVIINLENENIILQNRGLFVCKREDRFLYFNLENEIQSYLEFLARILDLDKLEYIYFDIEDKMASSYINIILRLYKLKYIIHISKNNKALQELSISSGVNFSISSDILPEKNIINVISQKIEKDIREKYQVIQIHNNLEEAEIMSEALHIWGKKWIRRNIKQKFLI